MCQQSWTNCQIWGDAMYVTIEKRASQLVNGRRVESWENYHRCWVDIKNLYGQEVYTSLQAGLENVINFETRFCKKLDAMNTKNFRVNWDGRIFKILYVDYKNYKKNKITIKAQENV